MKQRGTSLNILLLLAPTSLEFSSYMAWQDSTTGGVRSSTASSFPAQKLFTFGRKVGVTYVLQNDDCLLAAIWVAAAQV